MTHEIIADANTSVGYNFLTKEYFVKNLDTTTTLFTPADAKHILDITAPFNSISEDDIEKLLNLLRTFIMLGRILVAILKLSILTLTKTKL